MQLKPALKNTVYLASDSLKEVWSEVFQSFELEINSDLTKRPYYIFCESLSSLDSQIDWEAKIFCVNFPSAKEWELPHARFYAGSFSADLLEYPWAKDYIARAFSIPSIFKFSDEQMPRSFRWNCAWPLSFGLFCDQIFIELEAADFQIDQVKRYLDQFFFIYLMLEKSEIVKAGVEIELIIGDSWLSLQLIGAAKTFWREYVDAALSSGEGFEGSLDRLRAQCFAFELIHLRNSGKICFTSIFTKEQKSNHAFIIQNLAAFTEKLQEVWSSPSPLKEAGSPEHDLIKARGPQKLDEGGKFALIKRIVDFLKSKSAPEELSALTFEKLLEKIKTYPKQKQVRNLLEADVRFILSCLKDPCFFEGFKNSFGELYQNEANDEFMDEIVERLEALSLEDAGEFVFDGSQDFDETLTRVQGWFPEEEEATTLVKGGAPEKEAVTIIKGESVDLAADDRFINEIKRLDSLSPSESQDGANFQLSREEFHSKASELWHVKKMQIAAKVKDEVAHLRSSGATIENVATKVREIVSKELSIEGKDCEHFVSGLIDSTSEQLLESKLGRSSEEVRAELEQLKFDMEIDKRDDQLRRMKRIIDSMKEQIAKAGQEEALSEKDAKAEVLSETRDWQGRLHLLEGENEELKRNLKSLEIKHERQEKQIKTQQESIEATEQGPEVISADVAREMIDRAEERSQQQVEASEAKLQTAETRIEVMSSKINNQKIALDESNNLRAAAESRCNMSSAAMSKFKAKAESLERKVKSLEELLEQKEREYAAIEASSKKNGTPSGEVQAVVEAQEKEIVELKKSLNETEKNLKSSLLKNKQYEQKAKFMNSQLDEAKKRIANGPGSGSLGANNNQQQEHKLKQLEMINKKSDAALQKVSQELIAKKKALLDLKKENTALQNKIKELGRKTSKNAA